MDRSIMAATPSCRHLTAGQHVGVSPPDSHRENGFSWMEGGKTPFIIDRDSQAEHSKGQPPVSLVGDCCLDSCMDVSGDDPAIAKDR